jgi:lipopolysaccharide transport system ATP-binding protein
MSSDQIAIRVQGLSKCYQIYENPRDRLKQFFLPRLLKAAGARTKSYFHEFLALNDVSFEVKRGETVGIIGRNGSGKSTLLQLICGTLSPSYGQCQLNGRVAALLELGAGFNPEFTGRENVYMAASLYGLSRRQIDDRFGQIASFADIGDYIEQPVKTYSSGMYVRLAFAVIAHVDADILVIDEALAVGDAVFTQRCMRFIRKFREHGTLLFVSHDMHSVLSLCQNAVWLDQGKVRDIGPAKAIAEAYLQYTLQEVYGEEASLQSLNKREAPNPKLTSSDDSLLSEEPIGAVVPQYTSELQVHGNLSDANGWKSGAGEILSVQLLTADGQPAKTLKGGERVRMIIRAITHQHMERPIVGFLVRDRLGQDLFGENTLPFTDLNPCSFPPGTSMEGVFEFTLPMLPNGQYVVMTSLAEGDLFNNIQHHWLYDALVLNVSSSKVRWGLVGVPFKNVCLKAIQ